MLCLALSNSTPHFHLPPPTSHSHSHSLLSSRSQQNTLLFSSFINPNPPKLNINNNQMMTKKSRPSSFGPICRYSPPLSPQTLQWVCTVSSAVLMLAKGTAVQKTFLVPLFALQAPQRIFSWIRDEYGAWTVFLALLVRLFYFIPGELELPFMAMLLVAVAPHQIINLRGTQAGAIVSLLIAGYMGFQHFSRLGGFQKAFDQGSAVATIAVICIAVVPCLLLI